MRTTRLITAVAGAAVALLLTPGTAAAVPVDAPVYLTLNPTPPPHDESREKCWSRVEIGSGWSEDAQVCIHEEEGEHWGYVQFWTSFGSDVSVDATVYVKQCRPNDLTACSEIAANHQVVSTDSSGYAWIRTSGKPTSFGHVYQACASLSSSTGMYFVNACSQFMT